MQMGINSCKYLHELQKEALKSAYIKKSDNGDDDDGYDDDLETDLGEAELMEDD
jgi:hypothetical protein